MISSLVRKILWGFFALFSLYAVIFLLKPEFVAPAYGVSNPSHDFKQADLFRYLYQYVGIDFVGFAVFAFLAARSESTALARTFLITVFVWAVCSLAFCTLAILGSWRNGRPFMSIYVWLYFVAVVVVGGWGLLRLESTAHKKLVLTSLKFAHFYILSGLAAVKVTALFNALNIAVKEFHYSTFGAWGPGRDDRYMSICIMLFVTIVPTLLTFLTLACFSAHSSVRTAFFVVGLVVCIVDTPLSVGAYHDWFVQHHYITFYVKMHLLLERGVVFLVLLVGLKSVNNEANDEDDVQTNANTQPIKDTSN